MKITYEITEEDYINFNLFHLKNSKTARMSLNLQRFVPPVFFVIFSFPLAKFVNGSLFFALMIFTIVSILWIIFYPKYFDRFVVRHVRKMMNEGKNDGLIGDYCAIFSDEGIVEISPKGETRVTWSGIQALKEDELNFYLYNSSVSAMILPKKFLENVKEVREFIKKKMGAS